MKEPKGPGHTTPLHPHTQATGQAEKSTDRRKSVGDPGRRREPPVSLDERRHNSCRNQQKMRQVTKPDPQRHESPPHGKQ